MIDPKEVHNLNPNLVPAAMLAQAEIKKLEDHPNALAILAEYAKQREVTISILSDCLERYSKQVDALDAQMRHALGIEPHQALQFSEDRALIFEAVALEGDAGQAANNIVYARRTIQLLHALMVATQYSVAQDSQTLGQAANHARQKAKAQDCGIIGTHLVFYDGKPPKGVKA